jgi:hypothetical protein
MSSSVVVFRLAVTCLTLVATRSSNDITIEFAPGRRARPASH